MAEEKILVTGAGGFLGKCFVETAVQLKMKIIATDRNETNLQYAKNLGCEIVYVDLLNKDATLSLFQNVKTVVHIAGLFDFSLPYELLYNANVKAVENILEFSLISGVKKFIHVSSVAVYGIPEIIPIREDGKKRPRNNYEKTKLEGENLVLKYHREKGLPALVLRPTLIYGPGSKYGLALFIGICSLLHAVRREEISMPRSSNIFHNVHVKDVARALIFLLNVEGCEGEIFNCADERPISWGEFFDTILPLFNLRTKNALWMNPLISRYLVPLTEFPPGKWILDYQNKRISKAWGYIKKKFDLKDELLPRLDRDFFGYLVNDFSYDNSKLKNLGFSYEFPDPREGIVETINWYKNNKWIK